MGVISIIDLIIMAGLLGIAFQQMHKYRKEQKKLNKLIETVKDTSVTREELSQIANELEESKKKVWGWR